MLVIPQQPYTGPLPQPAGPGLDTSPIKALPAGRFEPHSDVAGPSLTDKLAQQGAAKPLGRAGTFARAHTMVTPPTSAGFSMQAQASSSSRASSPLSSTPSSYRSSPRLRSAVAGSSLALATPTSTIPSSVSSSAEAPASKSSRKAREAYVDIYNATSKGKAKEVTAEDPAAIPYEIPDIAVPSFARKTKNAQRDLARVWEAVAGARRIAVVTGAGISVSSPANIPDFRSTAGLFRKLKEKHPNAGLSSGKDLFDANLFKSPSTSSLFYSMVAELKAMADAAQPTSFHHLLKRLDLEGRLQRVYTQNIDGLEEKAGLTFGLGETADSRAALRALGKRKRELGHGPDLLRKGMARSKSDSAVLLSRQSSMASDEPMFPRSIPLHGSLSTMTCQICGHKVYLSLASSGQQTMPRVTRELSPDAGDQATAAMDLLSQGEPVSCKQCEARAEVRSVAGLRSRGVGFMKVDVVLYNGQNEGAERVGDCLERDILGLRDPNEASVPESHRERAARERKERKEQQAFQSTSLQPIMEAASTDDAFASAFGDADGAENPFWAEATKPGPIPDAKPKRQQRLKPLPPDLLIVAGTSLKVPGTKRVVREFAKACRAQDECIIEESSAEDSDAENATTSKPRRKQRSRSGTPSNSAKCTSKGTTQDVEDEEDEDDINAPIRTILLNYDYPLPHSSWDDVFDVWVQGDVQQAALGLWQASTYPAEKALNGFSMHSDFEPETLEDLPSWAPYMDLLEKERVAEKKASRSKSTSRSQSTLEGAWQNTASAKLPTPVSTPKKKAAAREHVSASPRKAATVAPIKKATKATTKTAESPAKKKTKAATSTTTAKKASAASARPPKATSLSKHVATGKKAATGASTKAVTAAAGGKTAKPVSKSAAAKAKQAQTAKA